MTSAVKVLKAVREDVRCVLVSVFCRIGNVIVMRFSVWWINITCLFYPSGLTWKWPYSWSLSSWMSFYSNIFWKYYLNYCLKGLQPLAICWIIAIYSSSVFPSVDLDVLLFSGWENHVSLFDSVRKRLQIFCRYLVTFWENLKFLS